MGRVRRIRAPTSKIWPRKTHRKGTMGRIRIKFDAASYKHVAVRAAAADHLGMSDEEMGENKQLWIARRAPTAVLLAPGDGHALGRLLPMSSTDSCCNNCVLRMPIFAAASTMAPHSSALTSFNRCKRFLLSTSFRSTSSCSLSELSAAAFLARRKGPLVEGISDCCCLVLCCCTIGLECSCAFLLSAFERITNQDLRRRLGVTEVI